MYAPRPYPRAMGVSGGVHKERAPGGGNSSHQECLWATGPGTIGQADWAGLTREVGGASERGPPSGTWRGRQGLGPKAAFQQEEGHRLRRASVRAAGQCLSCSHQAGPINTPSWLCSDEVQLTWVQIPVLPAPCCLHCLHNCAGVIKPVLHTPLGQALY